MGRGRIQLCRGLRSRDTESEGRGKQWEVGLGWRGITWDGEGKTGNLSERGVIGSRNGLGGKGP